MGLTEVPQPCRDLREQLKEEYGDDFFTNREKFPLTSDTIVALSAITDCKDYFKYDDLVTEFCGDIANFEKSVGEGKTCKDFDTDGSKTKQFCLSKENSTDVQPRMRVRTDICNSTYLKGKYPETAVQFCRENPQNYWCGCYNVKNGVCDASSENMTNAAGCMFALGNLDENKDVFKDGYQILRDNAVCRPEVCDNSETMYIPPDTLQGCETSYRICGKDIDIRSSSNSDVVLACHRGTEPLVMPDWVLSAANRGEQRKPPFDKYPWNKLPITRWPTRFRWKDKNVRYLTYASTASVSMCCLCVMLILSALTRRR